MGKMTGNSSKWIDKTTGRISHQGFIFPDFKFECPRCHKISTEESEFCPKCGLDMELKEKKREDDEEDDDYDDENEEV